ncbi:hypothetical protein GALMADRAFT_210832 [Galerina marginata CBS 339.88]|uniref:Uncharacterized protein n=1 Tax=Galerina marginata (strain CBS 339.88) TaxID=685588 RepID=A0A067TAZ2_GALM3|nr:hypothetical protein GALMADRAFT_210832 [Galerina marginata CBS 339.88]
MYSLIIRLLCILAVLDSPAPTVPARHSLGHLYVKRNGPSTGGVTAYPDSSLHVPCQRLLAQDFYASGRGVTPELVRALYRTFSVNMLASISVYTSPSCVPMPRLAILPPLHSLPWSSTGTGLIIDHFTTPNSRSAVRSHQPPMIFKEEYLCAYHCFSSIGDLHIRVRLVFMRMRRIFCDKLRFWFEINSLRTYEPNGWESFGNTWSLVFDQRWVLPASKDVKQSSDYSVIIPNGSDTEQVATPQRHKGGGAGQKKFIKPSLLERFIDATANIELVATDYRLINYMDDVEFEEFRAVNPQSIAARLPLHEHVQYLNVTDIRTLANRHGIFIHSKLKRDEAIAKINPEHHCDTCDEFRPFLSHSEQGLLHDHDEIIIKDYQSENDNIEEIAKLHKVVVTDQSRARNIIGTLRSHVCTDCPTFYSTIQARQKRSKHVKLVEIKKYVVGDEILRHDDRVVSFIGYEKADETMDIDNTIKANIPLHVLCNLQPHSTLKVVAEKHGVQVSDSSAKLIASLSRHDCAHCPPFYTLFSVVKKHQRLILTLSDIEHLILNKNASDTYNEEPLQIHSYGPENQVADDDDLLKAVIPLHILCDSQPISILKSIALHHGIPIHENASYTKIIHSLKVHSCQSCPRYITLLERPIEEQQGEHTEQFPPEPMSVHNLHAVTEACASQFDGKNVQEAGCAKYCKVI